MQNMIIETAQAMNSIQLAMAHSIAVTDLAMETTADLAQQAVSQMMPSVAPVPAGTFIDTYA
ncbi:MAG: hypothetical protein IKC24_02565 [Oscillospiraceae bacterium]|nr:hypothetical protein [Oscillospiraceae bacterium]MBR6678587.1 hypothetical protein [Oscillospiraceae bacterium]